MRHINAHCRSVQFNTSHEFSLNMIDILTLTLPPQYHARQRSALPYETSLFKEYDINPFLYLAFPDRSTQHIAPQYVSLPITTSNMKSPRLFLTILFFTDLCHSYYHANLHTTLPERTELNVIISFYLSCLIILSASFQTLRLLIVSVEYSSCSVSVLVHSLSF